jgi:RNA polymerase sigma-70 factor (ECF subfamily)
VTRHGFDAAYIERLGRGDAQTEAHFSAYFGELIRIKARARRLPPSLADDVRQETLLRVLRTLRAPAGLKTAECLGAFVNGVCNNVLRERVRDQKRHEPPADDDARPVPDTRTPSPEAQLLTTERKAAVRRVLDTMAPHNSRLLRAILLEEQPRDEICREFGVTAEYLRVLLHRAKKEFRRLYSDREGAWPPPGARGEVEGGLSRPAPRAWGL